jgi:hypothetical protein
VGQHEALAVPLPFLHSFFRVRLGAIHDVQSGDDGLDFSEK